VCEGVAVGGMPTEEESQECRKLGATLARASKNKGMRHPERT